MESERRSHRTSWRSQRTPVASVAAFEEFFRGERRRLHEALSAITGTRSEAEDIGQEAFLPCWERWDRVNGMEDPAGYLHRTAINVFRDRSRRAPHREARRGNGSAAERVHRRGSAVDGRFGAQGASPRQRAALVLTEGLGYSAEEAGQLLGIKARPSGHFTSRRVRRLAGARRTSMADLRTLVRDEMERAGSPSYSFEDLGRRRDRKRRNQRITAGVVGIAVFVAAVWIVTSGGSLDRSENSVVPAGSPDLRTGPAETGPLTGPAVARDWYDDWYDAGFLVGSSPKEPEYAIPPEGAVPSTPEEGELVAQFRGPYPGRFAYVYADGRVISWRHSPRVIGERRLTPEGVELVRSGALQPEAFIGHAYEVPLEVPLDVWENPKVKPFVPSRYAVCYSMESGAANAGKMGGYEQPSRVVGFFPAPARAILRGETSFVAEGDHDSAPLECSEGDHR